jgi:hypothetical protein
MRTINANIYILEDYLYQGHYTDSNLDHLKASLELETIAYEIKELARPKTVCSHTDCVSYHEKQRHHKHPCHDPCSLHDLQIDKVQDERIVRCAAFGNGKQACCNKCGHHWQRHLHMMWEVVQKSVMVQEPAVLQCIHENASATDIIEAAGRARQERFDKYHRELAFINKAAAQFSVYLHGFPIEPYDDDPTMQYLDHMFNEDVGKFGRRGFPHDDYAAQGYRDELGWMEMCAESGDYHMFLDQEGVEDLIKQLYDLELVGPELRRAVETVQKIMSATNERAAAALPHVTPAKRKYSSV